MMPMTSARLQFDLRNYEAFADGVDSGVLIKWTERERWTTVEPMTIDEHWLRGQLGRIATALEKDVSRPYGPPSRVAHADRHRSERLTAAAVKMLHGSLPNECERLVNACFASEAWLPLTVPRTIEANEPCGMVYDPCNLGPEYIRHFMRVLYDKECFTKTLGQGFFPFENRDHLVHSFLVVLMGQVLLSAPVDAKGREHIAMALGESPGELSQFQTVGTLAEHVYAVKGMAPQGTSAAQWMKRVWPAVALWHDSGYDAATWSLLTWRVFSHSFAVRTALESCNVAVKVFDEVRSFLGSSLAEEVRSAISRSAAADDGYRHLWCLEECHVQCPNKRPWGRYHALFSAFEFIELLRRGDNRDDASEQARLRHLGAAIAHHHEQAQSADRDAGSLTEVEVAKVFVASPIGSILAFADLMSGFARTKLKSTNATGGLGLEIDCDSQPLFIWLPSSVERLAFCRGIQPSALPTFVKLRAVWGDFLEADSGGAGAASCSKRDCTLRIRGAAE